MELQTKKEENQEEKKESKEVRKRKRSKINSSFRLLKTGRRRTML